MPPALTMAAGSLTETQISARGSRISQTLWQYCRQRLESAPPFMVVETGLRGIKLFAPTHTVSEQ